MFLYLPTFKIFENTPKLYVCVCTIISIYNQKEWPVEVNDNHAWPFLANKPFLPSKFYTPFTNAASFSRTFSAPVAYIQNACHACSPMHAYVYILDIAPKSAYVVLWPWTIQKASPEYPPSTYTCFEWEKGATERSSAREVAQGKSDRLRQLHVAYPQTNNLWNSICFCFSHRRTVVTHAIAVRSKKHVREHERKLRRRHVVIPKLSSNK